jgi:hypothetical protein
MHVVDGFKISYVELSDFHEKPHFFCIEFIRFQASGMKALTAKSIGISYKKIMKVL